ncbi:hypothetical protein GbCGDNIH6_8195 [Granulibacter bethesdensis]|nr:hypothetical protein GbCGDNIH6_8195 [Granulibacter bethesdensis]
MRQEGASPWQYQGQYQARPKRPIKAPDVQQEEQEAVAPLLRPAHPLPPCPVHRRVLSRITKDNVA